jgi:F0F1-type ATP synthase, delta subunit (mitochondrial oligomycin sensitivity protein)
MRLKDCLIMNLKRYCLFIKVNLSSLESLQKELVDEIIQRVEKVLNRKIEPEISVNEALIGGFELRLSGLVLDTSVRGVLQNLSNKVKSL